METKHAPSSSVPSLDALDLSPTSSLDSARSNDSSDDHIQLEHSMMLEMEHRDRTIVRRASTRLDAFAIRTLQSGRLGSGTPLAVDTTGSLALFNSAVPARPRTRESRYSENEIDLEGTVRSTEDMYSPHGVNQRHGRLSHSIRRTMSHIVQGTPVVESGRAERRVRIIYNIGIFVLAFWALFMEDLNVLLLPASADYGVLFVSWCVFGLFFAEVVIFSLFLPSYLSSPQFWMETLAVISLLPLGPFFILYGMPTTNNGNRGTELRYTLSAAGTINLIMQPIRAAAMANRTALSGSKLLEYSTDLLGGVVAVATSPKRMFSNDGRDPDPFAPDAHHVKMFHDTINTNTTNTTNATNTTSTAQQPQIAGATKESAKSRRDSSGVFGLAMLKPDHQTPKRSYSGVLGGGGSGGTSGSSGRRGSQATATNSVSSKQGKRHRRRSSVLSKLMGTRLRRSSSGHLSIQGDDIEEDDDDDLKTSMLGKSLLARTNLNVLVGLIVVMPAIGLLKTYALDLFPQQGLRLLHETNCMDDMRSNNFTHLSLSAAAYASVTEGSDKKDQPLLSKNNIDDTITRNPSYQILSVVLCGHRQVYDPFRIHENMNVFDIPLNQRSGAVAKYLNVRASEVWHIEVKQQTDSQKSSTVSISLRSVRVSDSMFSVVLTTTLLIVVVIWSSAFTHDYRVLITKPLHHVIHLLRRLASNPRLAVDFGVQQRDMFLQDQRSGSPKSKNSGDSSGKSESLPITSEIQIIEASIAKFGRLLHVGFGEAGITIIARNLMRGKFDPVQPGKKITAIFGFCDIRNFTDCCEVLREAVMIFTNQIARIVHSSVHASGGDVNKNIGDAFLAVWKLSEKELVVNQFQNAGRVPSVGRHEEKTPAASASASASASAKAGTRKRPQLSVQTSPSMAGSLMPETPGSMRSIETRSSSASSSAMRRGSTYVHHLTKDPTVPDKSLKAFLDIILLLDRSPAVQMYAKSSALQAKLPGFRVRMGFGLHLGWGIEVCIIFLFVL